MARLSITLTTILQLVLYIYWNLIKDKKLSKKFVWSSFSTISARSRILLWMKKVFTLLFQRFSKKPGTFKTGSAVIHRLNFLLIFASLQARRQLLITRISLLLLLVEQSATYLNDYPVFSITVIL